VREHLDDVLLESGIRVSGGQLLERFQFTREQQQSEVGDLSGGERRRLELLLSLMEAPNLLLLDEPTNDLDIETLDILEEYLDAWDGAVVVATHDRYFLERTCSMIFSIESDGSVLHHPGGWAAYRAEMLAGRGEPATPTRGAARPKSQSRRLTYNDQRELDELTRRIPRLETQRDRLAAQLDAAADDHAKAFELSAELGGVIDAVDAAETRWLELTEKAERLSLG
jgi:ATP-binding cassette subfamily F protein uup